MRDPAGRVYPVPPAFEEYHFWRRYLEVFENVLVLSRVRLAPGEVQGSVRADGPDVTFADLPDFRGPWQYVRGFPTLRRRIREAVEMADAFMLRAPGVISQLVWKSLRDRKIPFGVQVGGDPWEVFSPDNVRTIVRPLVRRVWTRELRQICHEASAVAYVTHTSLPRRYPASERAFVAHFSDVELAGRVASPEQLETRVARIRAGSSAAQSVMPLARLGTLGSLAQLYKGPDVLLKAVAVCLARGLNIEVEFAGDGAHRPAMEALAKRLGIAGRAKFLGALPPGKAVVDFLDRLDLFVLPSRTEGLPRAMIEAMARGCACIGTTVGGIPELLPPEDMVPPDDAGALAEKIIEVLSDPDRMERMARRNWENAREYLPEVLGARRRAFYRKVREVAESRDTAHL
jgi:glycosyltransferase involved in cell wall biosynthesis